jgi:hypothetical protein
MGGLFKGLADEIVEIGLAKRIINAFWGLVEIFCTSKGVDFLEFQEDIFRDNEFMEKILKLVPEGALDKAA